MPLLAHCRSQQSRLERTASRSRIPAEDLRTYLRSEIERRSGKPLDPWEHAPAHRQPAEEGPDATITVSNGTINSPAEPDGARDSSPVELDALTLS